MHAPGTMRLCSNAILAILLAGTAFALPAQSSSSQKDSTAPAAQAPLTVDRDPARSPDPEQPAAAPSPLHKQTGGYVLHTDVEEVVLNVTVLDGNRLVPDLMKENFQ